MVISELKNMPHSFSVSSIHLSLKYLALAPLFM